MYGIFIHCRLAVGTNKGLAVIDTETNTVLHILSSITSLLCEFNKLGSLCKLYFVHHDILSLNMLSLTNQIDTQ